MTAPAAVNTQLCWAPASERIGAALDRVGFGLLCLMVFNLPWEESLPPVGPELLSTWLGAACFAVVALRVATAHRTRRPTTPHYWMSALVGWIVLSLFWTEDWASTIARAGTYLQLLVMVWLIWELAYTEKRILGLLQAYVLGALTAALDTIYNFLGGHSSAQLATARGATKWDTSRYSIAGMNENDLGLILALSLPMCIYLLTTPRRPWIKMLCWVHLTAAFIAILLTASRGSFLAAIGGLTMLPFVFGRLSVRQKLVSLAAAIGAVAACVYLVPRDSWLRIIQFGSEITGGTMTHRTVIWAAGLDVFRNHALVGVGSGAYGASIYRMVDIPYVAHNTFLSVLVELGVVGALLFLALLASMAHQILRLPPVARHFWISLMLTWMIGVSALTWEYRKPTWLLFGLAAAHVYSRVKERHDWY